MNGDTYIVVVPLCPLSSNTLKTAQNRASNNLKRLSHTKYVEYTPPLLFFHLVKNSS